MIRLLLVDDHTIFRTGLRRLLSDETDIRVVDEAKDIGEMFSKLRQQEVDVVLLDVNMSGRSGLESLQSIRAEFPRLPVLLLSMYPAEQYALVALRGGANGYVTKDVESEELIKAIREVQRGNRYLTSAATQRLLLQPDAPHAQPPHLKLSAREHQILMMIVQGVSLTEIGTRMFISVKTVSTYRTRILRKLGVESNAELVMYAVRHKVVPC
ncbi:MAG: response regulator transcription factor [Aquabacterium sp.]|nr:MAG: response regulator transcription factor [Aquabacterium sp.]